MSFVDIVSEAKARLMSIEKTFQDLLIHSTCNSSQEGGNNDIPGRQQALELQVQHLQQRLSQLLIQKEEQDEIHHQAMTYETAKGTANAVLHGLFDQAILAKVDVLRKWNERGVIPTRDGVRNWKLDARKIRNGKGATLLHVAVERSMASENAKVKVVDFLIGEMLFDPNVIDVYGRTPLHAATMAGYTQVVKRLLKNGSDPLRQDFSGLTALSLVRTLSSPNEEIVQILAKAEAEARACKIRSSSESIPKAQAVCSAIFLTRLAFFVRMENACEFENQTKSLLSAVLKEPLIGSSHIAFDQLVVKHVPILFDLKSCTNIIRIDKLLPDHCYTDVEFLDELRVEAAAYGISIMSPTNISSTFPSWANVLVKLVLGITKRQEEEVEEKEVRDFPLMLPSPLSPLSIKSTPVSAPAVMLQTPPRTSLPKETPKSGNGSEGGRIPSPALSRSTGNSVKRQVWHYAVLFKGATAPLPGTVSVVKNESIAKASEDISNWFPLEDRLVFGSGGEYFITKYDKETKNLHLDRPYQGESNPNLKVYLSGSCNSFCPPYIASKRIWEREPGNKYEDHTSLEQELFQDYQFLDPESDVEVAVKLGPLANVKEAKDIVEEWRKEAKKLFEQKKCVSGLPCCVHYCPQKAGHMQCTETMAKIGRDIAKKRLGRATFSKALKPRASLQKIQSRFRGTQEWPGSPSTKPRVPTPIPNRPLHSTPTEAKRGHDRVNRTLDFS